MKLDLAHLVEKPGLESFRARFRPWKQGIWVIASLSAGLAIAVLPPSTAILLLAIAVLGVLSLIDTRFALVVLLTVAPLKTLIDTERPGTLFASIDIGQLLFGFLIALWLARAIAANRRLNLRWSGIYIPIISFILVSGLTIFVTFDARHTLKENVLWIEMLIMAVIAVSMLRKGDFGWMVAAVIGAAAAQSLIGIYEFFGGSGATHLWILDYQRFRAFGTFGQPNPFGAFMGLTLPLAIGLLLGVASEFIKVGRKYRKSLQENAGHFLRSKFQTDLITWGLYILVAAAGVVILAIGLVVSWSRGAWIGFAAAFMVLLLFAPKRRWIGISLVVLIVGGTILSSAIGILPASFVARFSDFAQDLSGFQDVRGAVISDANYAVLERFAHWQAALGMASDHPWLGVGFGAYEVAYPQYALVNWPFALGHAHNYYLNLLAETGLIGLSVYLATWITIFVLTIRCLRRTTGWQRGIALGLLGVWTHFSVHSFFDYLLVNSLFLHVGVMFGLIGGLLLATKTTEPTNN